MDEELDGIVDTSESTQEADPQTADESVDNQDSNEQGEEMVSKAEYDKAMELANNQKIRAEKAESKLKKPKEEPAAKADSGLSPLDTIALVTEKVTNPEDIEQVLDYAKFKGVSVSEALKSPTVKTLLSEKAEQRKVADATNVGTVRRSGKVSDETLLANADKGILPENDEDMRRLVALRHSKK